MANIVRLDRSLYDAKLFRAGEWKVAGTLCGNVDVATPTHTFCLTVPELDELIAALQGARKDVVDNSRPFTDPRIYNRIPNPSP